MTGFAHLAAQRRQAQESVVTWQEYYAALQAKYDPLISSYSAAADNLAMQFKALVEEAARLYQTGARAQAKAVSNQRKALQSQCEELNARVKAMRDELAQARATIKSARSHLARLQRTYGEAIRASTGHIAVTGFASARGVSEEIVREELCLLPTAILRCIAGVNYVHEVPSDFAVGRTGSKADNPVRTSIYLYICTQYFETGPLETTYRSIVIHEAGHVLFDWVMSSGQRWQWGQIYNQTLRANGRFVTQYARESLREDFGECLAMYIHSPEELRMRDQVRYTFIDSIIKEV